MAGFTGLPQAAGIGSSASAEWSIPVTERVKYDQIFDGLQPVGGFLTGDKVKPVLLNSNLPVDVLGRVWDLSDIDGDGMLDREEFSVAMHLVYRALEKNPVPPALPVDMIPLSKRMRGSTLPGAISVLPVIPGAPGLSAAAIQVLPGSAAPGSLPPVGVPGLSGAAVPVMPVMPSGRTSPMTASSAKWIVSPAEKAQYDEMFIRADTDVDGFVNGAEIKDIFLQSGLPQLVLAHIWNLCDTKTAGKLNSDQFALAMHLVQQTLKGIEPPAQLSPDMIPPSMRAFPFQDGGNVAPMVSFDTAGMKELDLLSKDIEDLKREKMKLEQEKAQKEADIKIRNGEVVSLQKELDALNHSVKQLELQKVEAQKRLDELDDKKDKLENSLKECKEKFEEEQNLIKELQHQITNRESIASNQEAEMKRMRDELNDLRQQEMELEQKAGTSRHQAEQLDRRLTDIQEQIKQVKTNIHQMRETQKTLQQSAGLTSDHVADKTSEEELDIALNTEVTRNTVAVTSASNSFAGNAAGNFDDFASDPFASKDPFQKDPFDHQAAPVDDPFHSEDPFTSNSDPFSSTVTKDPFASSVDPFAGDPFGDAFQKKTTNDSPSFSTSLPPKKATDPWGAFGALSGTMASDLDTFDPFHVDSVKESKPVLTDPFGTGSFVLSPSDPPQLPPKQKRAAAPPRPPAPRPATQGRADPFDGDDPFESKNQPTAPSATLTASAGIDPFASFADFSPTKFASEAEQIAWATRDSNQEWQRLKRIQEQEQADLELALALSRQDT